MVTIVGYLATYFCLVFCTPATLVRQILVSYIYIAGLVQLCYTITGIVRETGSVQQRPWHKLSGNSEKGQKRIQLLTIYPCTPNSACVCGIGPVGVFFCLCCMHSLNPLLKLNTVQCRNLCRSSQITLLPLSPMPPSLFSLSPFSSSPYLSPFSFLTTPSLFFARAASSLLLYSSSSSFSL